MNRCNSKHLILLLLYLLPVSFFGYHCLVNGFSTESFLEYRDYFLLQKNNHLILFSLLFVMAYSALVAASISVTVVMNILAGYLFGVFSGSLLACIGGTIGSYFLFAFTRYTARGLHGMHSGTTIESADSIQGFVPLFFMRLSPLVPAPLLSVGAAVMQLKNSVFLAATFLGSLPLILIYAMIGSHLGQIQHLQEIYDTRLILVLLLFTMGSCIPLLNKGRRKDMLRVSRIQNFLMLAKKGGTAIQTLYRRGYLHRFPLSELEK